MKTITRAAFAALLFCGFIFGQSPSTTVLTGPTGSSTFGQAVTFTATVTFNAAPVTGKVTFYYDVTPLGVGTLNAGGVATFKSSLIPPGNHSLIARYQGIVGVAPPSFSNTIAQSVTTVTSAWAGSASYTAGTTPTDIVQADFNGDGITDLAMVNSGSNTISVFLGNGASGVGNGTFQTAVSPAPATGTSPTGIAAGDFNQDGKVDLVVTNTGDGTVGIFLGNGDGTFQTQTTAAVGAAPWFPAVGDFDRDGIEDIIVTNNGSNTVSVLLGVGNGTFRAQSTFGTGSHPAGLVLADFSGDGVPDVAIANNQAGTITVLSGDGAGAFNPYDTITLANGSNPFRLAAARFTNSLDLVVSYSTGNTVTWISHQDGFLTPQNFTTGSSNLFGLAAADIDGDGKLDIVAAGNTNTGASFVSALLGDGTGTFTLAQVTNLNLSASAAPLALIAGDFNGDGKTDLALADSGNNKAVVALGLIPTTTTLAPAPTPNPSTFGQTVAVTATVSQSTATGTVTFFADAVQIGTPAAVSAGQAQIAVSTLTTGSHALTATYNGDTTFGASTTATPTTQTVNQASSAGNLTTSPNPSGSGLAVTMTATVTLGATGTVTFHSAGPTGPVVGTGTLNGGNPNIATAQVSNLPVGDTSLIGVYSGDVNFNASNTNSVTQTVRSATTTTLTSSPNPSNVNQQVTLTAQVTSIQAGTITGTVTFKDGAATIGAPVNLVGGVASLQFAFNTVAQHSITAVYSGDTTYYTSTSPVVTQSVGSATTTTLSTVSPSTPFFGQPVSLTATVNPVPGGGTLGFVTFYDGATVVGTGQVSAGGTATMSTPLLGQGTRSLRARYNGNPTLGPSLSAAVSTTVSSRPQPGFAAATNYPIGANTLAVALGDFNRDGIQDIAAVQTTTSGTVFSGVQILLGNANGTFQAAQPYATAAGASSIAVADINGDGYDDLVMVTGAGIEALINTHNAVLFGSSVVTQTPPGPSMALADFDGDGYADVIVSSSGAVVLLQGAGNGSFRNPKTILTPPATAFVIAADFNNDGKPDIAEIDTNGGNGNLNILLGNGDGTFQGPSLTHPDTALTSLSAGDFNNDGKADLAFGTGNTHAAVVLGNGDGTFGPANNYSLANAGFYIATGDFTGDGILDLVSSDVATAHLEVIAGAGNGAFGSATSYPIASALAPGALAVGNFLNGDGRGDIVVGYGPSGNIGVLLGTAPIPSIGCGSTSGQIPTNVSFNLSCSASGGIAPYTYAIATGTIPPGLALNAATGAISGTPTTPGSYTFSVGAADSDVPVQNAPPATVTINVVAHITMFPSPLPTGAVGTNYSVTVVSGGTAPFTCGVVAGSLPPGIGINSATCVLSGIPTTAGDYSFSIGVSDSGTPQQNATQAYTLTISPAATTITVTRQTGANPSPFGQSLTFKATVTPSNATGTVTISDGATQLGSGPLSAGIFTVTTAGLTAGVHSITATYGGDANNTSSNSSALSQTVNQVATTTTVTSSSVLPAISGSTITFDAAVSPSGTGNVTFKDGSTTLATRTLSGGHATFFTSTLSAGVHSITAVYAGDTNDAGSTSSALAQRVYNLIFSDNFNNSASGLWANDAGNWSATAGTYDASAGSFAPSAHSLLPFALTDFSVHVDTTSSTGDGGVWLRAVNAGSTATGINGVLLAIRPGVDISFYDVTNGTYPAATNSVPLSAAPHGFDIVVTGNTYSVYADGGFTPITSLTSASAATGEVGLHDTSTLGFDNFFLADLQTPAQVSLNVAPSPSVLNQNVTLTATVSPSSASGSVIFHDGTSTIGSGVVSAGSATFQTASLTVGTHPLSAIFAPDGNDLVDAAGISAVFSHSVISNTTTTTLTSSPNPSAPGSTVTLTATVSPSTATGSVGFYEGTNQLGQGTLANGVATASATFASGNHVLTAVYGGSQVFLGSTSATVTQSVSQSLSILTSSLPPGQVGQAYSAGLQASGGSGLFTWSASGLPAGLSISSGGAISGTPTAPFNGSVNISVSSSGSQASATLALVISSPPLQIGGSGNLGDVPVGTAVSSTFTASGGASPYSWSVTGIPGITVDANGVVRLTAAAAGSYAGSITVKDSTNTTASVTLNLLVLGITGTFPAGTTTTSYSGSASGVGGASPYSYTASGIPDGMTFAGGTLTGLAKNPGTYSVGITVTDAKGTSVSGNFSVVLTGPAAATLTVTTSSLPDGFVGQPYSQALGASGGAPGYTWSQSGGSLPAGLSLDSSGTVLGTPTATGTYSVGVQVSDTSGGQAVGTVAINIQPAPLQITNGATLPAGLVGVDYPAQILTATGGTAPYVFSVKGTLPAGLTLSGGQITGTPSAGGDFGFTLVVTDAAAKPVSATLDITGTIKPNAPDLVLSSATASFALTAGTSATPSPTTVPVASSVVAQVLNFTASASVPWVTVGGATATPGSISVGLNNAALSLSAAGSPYSGIVTISCTTDSCAGKTQTITVSLTVKAAPPQLTLGTPLLSFVSLASTPQATSAALSIVNAGGGSLAISSVTASDGWLSVGAFPPTVAPGPGGSVTITANPAGLNPGYYLGSVTVNTNAGSASVPVTLLISAASVMTLGPSGTQFSMPQGGALGNPSGSFLVSVSTGSVSYTAAILPGAPWLSGGGPGSAAPSSPGTVNFSIDQAAVGALGAGAYYGTIRVSGSGIVNSPQDFQLVLNISPAASKVVPDPQPAGQVFITSGATVPSQSIQLFASSKNPIAFQASASPIDGTGWLSVSPATGSTSAGNPASVTVNVNPASLQPGVYRGTVSFSFGTVVRTVNVTVIRQAALPSDPASLSSTGAGTRLAPRAVCADAQLVPTQTGLVSNFSAPASWPTPLAIKLVDTCGSSVAGAQIVATFSNGDPPLILNATDSGSGVYSGTWTPRKTSSQVTIQARASVPGYTTATTQIAGQVAPNTAPSLAPNGTFDVFHPQVGAGLGPGNIVQIYGTGLAGLTSAPTVLPLPTEVNGTQVLIGGVTAPLYYVSPGQINAQVPFELSAGSQYQVIVSANGALTTPQPIQLTASVPAILQFTSGAVVAQHADGTLILDSSPAAPGENVVIYLTGLGATDIPVPSGTASPSNPPARVIDTPVLTLNGANLPVAFAGLTPTLVGLYQINFQIPAATTTGTYDLLISQNGTISNKTVLQVK